MSKVEVVCPYCKKPTVVEKSFDVSAHGLNKVQCSHCSKRWEESLTEPGVLSKSAPSSGMAKLRDSLAELGRVVDAYVARRAAQQPARFQPQGYEPATVVKFVAGMQGGLLLESDITATAEAARQHSAFVTKAADRDAVAHAELEKALANGKPLTSPNYTRPGDGLEKEAPPQVPAR